MGNTDYIPDTTDFTKEVEGTIEDLFSPKKNIIINPLTNEIQEATAGPDTPSHCAEPPPPPIAVPIRGLVDPGDAVKRERSPDLEAKLTMHQGEREGKTYSALSESSAQKQNDVSSLELGLDLDLELERAGASPEEAAIPTSSAPKKAIGLSEKEGAGAPQAKDNDFPDSPELLDQLEQDLLTLEWDVSMKYVSTAQDVIRRLEHTLARDRSVDLATILKTMTKVLEILAREPENAPTAAPKALRYALGVLRTLMSHPDQQPSERQALIESALARLCLDNAESETSAGPPELRQKHKDRPDTVDELPLQPTSKPLPAWPEVSPAAEEHPTQGPNEPLTGLSESSAKHLSKDDLHRSEPEPAPKLQVTTAIWSALHYQRNALDRCIACLRPMEDLLGRTQGMEKLCHFHQGLRRDLEDQRDRLLKLLASSPDTALHQESTRRQQEHGLRVSADEGTARQGVETHCPWNQLTIGTWNRVKVAFPSEHVAFVGSVPWRNRRYVQGKDALELATLKRWPWSRLYSLFTGPLAQVPEAQLKGMRFPVIDNPLQPSRGPETQAGAPYLVLLYQQDQGAVLVLDGTAEKISDTSAKTWLPSTDRQAPCVGYIEIQGEQLPVVSFKPLLARDRCIY